ncbi:hypothetical protein BC830DRAFT_162504 [Chytriomyces sp. MP71]|nr:hypothetical protein BC830DRAFT_162504 [Chytriomyces sp. MP71]
MAGAVTAVTGRREKAGFAKIGETLVAAACSGRRLRRAAGGPRPLREGGWRRTRMTNRREEADAMRAGWRRGRQPASRGERRCVLRLSLSPFDAWSGTEFATATLPYFLLGFFASPTNGHQRVERPVRGTVLSTGAPWLRRSGNRTGLDPVAKQMPEYSASPARRLALVSSLLQSLDLDYMDNHHNHALASAVDALAALIALCPLPSSCELEALALFDARVLAPFLSALRAQSKTTAAIQPLVVHGFKVGCIPQSQHSPQLLRVKNWLIESLPDTHEHDDDPDEHRVLFVLDLLAALLTQLATHIQRDNDPDPNVSHTLRDIINLCINVALPLHPVHSGKPSRCQKRVVSTILPQLFDLPSNLVDHEELIQWLWTRIEALSGDPVVAGQHQDYPPLDEFAIQKDTSKSSAYVESVIRTIHLRNITTILVHLFNHFFGVIVTPAQSTAAAAVTARSSLHPKKQHHAGTGIPKKYRRQDAKDGIITGGNNNAPPHGDRDDALDWRGQTLPQPSNALPTLDLRGRALFWRIVQHALVSGDALAAKFALFLLKRVVDYSARVAVSGADSGAVQGGLSFSLGSGAGVDALRSLWDEYFVVLDIMQESGCMRAGGLFLCIGVFKTTRLLSGSAYWSMCLPLTRPCCRHLW